MSADRPVSYRGRPLRELTDAELLAALHEEAQQRDRSRVQQLDDLIWLMVQRGVLPTFTEEERRWMLA